MSGSVPEPLSITADLDERTVVIEWADEVRSVYDFEQLRWSCPCATCRGEMGRPGVLDGTDHLAPEQTDLEDIVQVGRYAVCPIWCDGHRTGIYTYQYLRELDRDAVGRGA